MKKLIAVASVLAIGASLTAGMAFARNKSNARVRVVHASPDAPVVDVLVNDTVRAFAGAPFEGVTGYETLPAGVYNFKVVPTGEMAGMAVIDVDQSLFYNRDYTVVAVDVLGSIEALPLLDNNKPVRKKMSRVRFVHASPDAPEVDVAVVGGPILFDDIGFKEVGDYIEVPRGIYDLEVRLSGSGAVALDLPGTFLEGGTTYTVYAMGLATGGQPDLRAVISEDSRRTGKKAHRRLARPAAASQRDSPAAAGRAGGGREDQPDSLPPFYISLQPREAPSVQGGRLHRRISPRP